MKVIGLTGGIASGKSTVSEIIKRNNIPVIDADIIAREIVESGRPALNEIKQQFGDGVINEDGTLDRRSLGNIVFSNPHKLQVLNQITHPRIINEIYHRIELYRNNNIYPVIFVDAALLIEMNMRELVDEVWLVVVEPSIQLKRLMERDHLSKDEAQKRINSQMTMKEKENYADVVISNNLGIHQLEAELNRRLSSLIH